MESTVDNEIESMVNNLTKQQKKKKTICNCSVKIMVKSKALELLESGEDVYILSESSKSSGKTLDKCYKKCTRPIFEELEYCFKHSQSADSGTAINWTDIQGLGTSRKASLLDPFFKGKTSNIATSNVSLKINKSDTNKPKIRIIISDDLLNFVKSSDISKIFETVNNSVVKIESDNNESDNDESDNDESDNNKSDNDESDNDESDNDEAVNNANSDHDISEDNESDEEEQETNNCDSKDLKEIRTDEENISCKIIKTVDGRTLYKDDSDIVYSIDNDESNANEIGVLQQVHKSNNPIIVINKKHYTVCKSITHRGKSFIKCELRGLIYSFKNNEEILTLIAKSKISKNGDFKIIKLDK